MQEAGYEIKPGKYISFRAEGQERFTRAKTIGENYTEERLKERIAGRNPRKQRMQTERKGISLIIDIQNSIKAQESKGYAHWAKIHNLQEAARTINYLTPRMVFSGMLTLRLRSRTFTVPMIALARNLSQWSLGCGRYSRS